MSFWKTFIILSPLFYALMLIALRLFHSLSSKYELSQILKQSSQTVEEKNLANASMQQFEQRFSFIEKMNAKLNVFGIRYKFEFLLIASIAAGVLTSILIHVLFKAGPLLMIYVLCVIVFVIYQFINNMLNKKKDELTTEFLEKLRDLTSYLSAGKSVPVALDECIDSGSISNVLFREFGIVRGDISLGKPMSEAFMEMYTRLDIVEIRTFAQTLQVYEDHGGNLIEIMQSSDRYFSQKLLVKNEQRVAFADIQNTQKIMIGAPLAFVFVMAIINPSFFGEFYATITGQIIGMIAVTMLLTGVYLSRKMLKL